MIIHENDIDYQKEAKRYVLNMTRGSKKGGKYTLHIKNSCSCPWSRGFYKYSDFDNYEDVKVCGKPFRKCKKCFVEE